MATTLRRPARGAHAAPTTPSLLPGLAVVAAAALIAVAAAVVLPDITAAGRMTTTPTHYMGLLMANQPWNLLLFMALPFAVIYLGLLPAALGLFPSWLGRAAVAFLAVYLTVASVYLVRWAIVPLTDGSGWRGPVDLIAVGIRAHRRADPGVGRTHVRRWQRQSAGVVGVGGAGCRARGHDLRHDGPVRARLGRSWPRHARDVKQSGGPRQ
jgi:hypothetical protein